MGTKLAKATLNCAPAARGPSPGKTKSRPADGDTFPVTCVDVPGAAVALAYTEWEAILPLSRVICLRTLRWAPPPRVRASAHTTSRRERDRHSRGHRRHRRGHPRGPFRTSARPIVCVLP